MSAKFSIIIPVYNVAPYLRECLRSVIVASDELKALSDKWSTEIICIDDCSTDGSGEILDELSSVYHSLLIVYHSPANAGVSAARNKGLEIATGDWIGFVDGDDVIRPETLIWVEQAIRATPSLDAVHFEFKPFGDGEMPEWHGEGEFVTHIDVGTVPRIFLDGGLWSKFYSRRLIGDARFKNYVRGEDCLFRAEVMAKAYQVVEIKASCYGYRQREGSAIHSEITARKLADELWLLELWRLWTKGDRELDNYRWRRLAQELTEFYAERFFNSPRKVRKEVWSKWKAVLLEVKNTKQFPRFNRIVLKCFSCIPKPSIAWLLFALPYKLKKWGIHR